MNLVVLTKQFGNYTGATISTIQLLKRISSKFDSVIVFTLKTDGTVVDNVDVMVLNNYLALIKALKNQKNVIGYSDDHLGFLFSLANIKYIHTYHGNWPDAKKLNLEMYIKSFYFIPLYKKTIKNACRVVSVSRYMQEHFVGPINSNSEVIYNGIKQKERAIKHRPSIKLNLRFLMVGNLDTRKYGKALKVFNVLQNNNFEGQVDIYGAIHNKTLAHKLNEFSFVNLMGNVDSISYVDYDGLICTSASENLPVSIIESIINGVPVISSNVGGIPEVVNDENGFLMDVNDYRSFAWVILKYRKKEISVDNLTKIKANFSWDNSSRLYMQTFKRVENK